MRAIENLRFYLQHFYWQDYALLGACFVGFFILLIISLSLRKFPTLAVFFIILSILASIFGFIYGENYIQENIRSTKLQVQSGKRLAFSKNIYFDINLQNTSERIYKICKINIRLQKPPKNLLEEIIGKLRPMRIYEIKIYDVYPNQNIKKEVVLPLKTPKKFRVYSKAKCF